MASASDNGFDVRVSALDDTFIRPSSKSLDPAWPAWKQLLEDLAETHEQIESVKLSHKTLGDAGAQRLAELLRGRLSRIHSLDIRCRWNPFSKT